MNSRLRGLTLTELLVALAITVIVGAIAIPVVASLKGALQGSANAQVIVSTAIQNARTIAMKEGQYAGVRFQQDANGQQYAIYIVNVPMGSLGANGLIDMYRAVEGRTPVQLPEGVAIADMVVRTKHADNDDDCEYDAGFYRYLTPSDLEDAGNLVEGKNINFTDTTSFSVIFDAKGQLVKTPCRMRCSDVVPALDGKKYYFRPGDSGKDFYVGLHSNECTSLDKIFNGYEYVVDSKSKFIQDDYANLGLGGELSRVQFKIFDTGKYNELDSTQKKYDYLSGLPDVYVNQYTGKLMGGK